jgi:hypothetical protein
MELWNSETVEIRRGLTYSKSVATEGSGEVVETDRTSLAAEQSKQRDWKQSKYRQLTYCAAKERAGAGEQWNGCWSNTAR